MSEAPDAQGAARVFAETADALRRGDWATAAACCDEASLAAFRRALAEALADLEALAQSVPDSWRELRALEHGAWDTSDEPASDPRAERRWRSWQALSDALGAGDAEELTAIAASEVFARWLEHLAPARSPARDLRSWGSGLWIRVGPPPPPAPEWHALDAVGVVPGASPAEVYVLYRVAGVAADGPNAPAGRVRVATLHSRGEHGWALAAGPDFLAADEPRPAPAGARGAYAGALAAQADEGLAALADAEDVLAAEAFYVPGRAPERERTLGARGLYARSAAVFAAYTERSAADGPGALEALKRAAFLGWRAATGFGPRSAVADYSDDAVADVWESVAILAARGALDDEFRAMLGWYYRTAPAFFDWVAAAVPWDGERLRAAVARFEGAPRLDLIATAGRGALGRYFAALAARA